MTDIALERRTSDSNQPPSPWASPEVHAALKALNEKRATGWRPAERTDYGAEPGKVDFLGRPITHEPATIYNSGLPLEMIAAVESVEAETAAWLNAHKEATPEVPLATRTGAMQTTTKTSDDTIKAHPQRNPLAGEGRGKQVTQRVLSFELTSDGAGAGVWRLVAQDAEGSHVTVFREYDMKLREAIDAMTPVLKVVRGKHYPCNFEITWRREGGWATCVSYTEGTMANKKAAEAAVEDLRAEAVASRPESDFDTFDQDCAPWVKDNDIRGKFFGNYDDLCNQYVVKPDKDIREAIRRALLKRLTGQDTLKAWSKTQGELLAALEMELRRLGYKRIDQTTGQPETDERASSPESGKIGQLEPKGSRSSNVPEQTKVERSSTPNLTIVDTSEKKDEIRSKFTMDMRGKDYLVVQGRVSLFRLEHPDWTIETDVIALTDNTAVFKATIKNPEGRVIATGHGRATEPGTKNLGGRFIEKAETAAIGRALALAGFGTDDTLDDRDYIADSPVAKTAS